MADISSIIEAAKIKYNEAKANKDEKGMAEAHAEAEAARATQGYSGGIDGSKVIKTPNYVETSNTPTSSNGFVDLFGSMITNTRAAAKDISNGVSQESAASKALTNVATDAMKTFSPSIYNSITNTNTNTNTTPSSPYNYEDIIGRINSYTPLPTLSWEEAMERAKAQLDPLYTQNLEETNKASDYNNLKSGFYGQLPGEVVKDENASKVELNRKAAIASLANELVNKSIADANAAEQAFLQKQGLMSNLIGNSIEAARAKSNDALNKSVVVAGQTGLFNPFYDVEVTDPEVLASYDNVQALIDKILASPDKEDDKKLPQAYALRAQKLIQNPDLAAKYGSDFLTLDAKNLLFNQNMATKQYEDTMSDVKFEQGLQREQMDLQKKQLELEEMYKKAQIANTYADNARQAAAAKAKSAKDDQFSAANSDQLWWYNYYKTFYQDPSKGMPSYANNPDRAYQEIVANKTGMVQQMGQGLYDALLEEQAGLASKVSNEKTIVNSDIYDNTALAEAKAQKKAGTLESWFTKNQNYLEQQLSSSAYNKILEMVYPDESKW